ncbi:MAG: retropepsin-like aspartic protease [Clostridium sp.]|uniref:retropepsin-like aspartic protease n=1 Tax=Clostridium sp. TaxID=1506 RepID=UPI003F32888B
MFILFKQNWRNPFFIEGIINGRQRKILLDTGADVSLIDENDLQDGTQGLEAYSGLVRSASGEALRIKGIKKGCEAYIGKSQIKFSPLVMERCKYIILGVDVIRKHPELLTTLLVRITTKPKTIGEVRLSSEVEVKEHFKDIFKTEIGHLNLCSLGKHSIKTTSNSPVVRGMDGFRLAKRQLLNAKLRKT